MAKKIKLDLRALADVSAGADGIWRARIARLGVDEPGATADEAFDNMIEVLRAKLDDEAMAEPWQAFVKEFGEEVEADENEARERAGMIERSHEASASFRVLNADTLDAAIAGETPTLVDFWAEWCMPCHMMAPILKEVADELGERLVVAKLNVDDNKEVWERFEIRGIPTLILFGGGRELHRIVGAGRPKQNLLEEIQPHLR